MATVYPFDITPHTSKYVITGVLKIANRLHTTNESLHFTLHRQRGIFLINKHTVRVMCMMQTKVGRR